MNRRKWLSFAGVLLALTVLGGMGGMASAAFPTGSQASTYGQGVTEGPVVERAVKSDTSAPLSTLIAEARQRPHTATKAPVRPRLHIDKNTGKPSAGQGDLDTAVQKLTSPLVMSPPVQSFDGVSDADNALVASQGVPPDTNGDVGPNHYFQTVNTAFEIFDKSGVLLAGPTANNAFFTGFGGLCETTNQGDPIVLYDPLANRWLFSQFAFNLDASNNTIPPYYQCIAVSTTGDPTGSYHRYAFLAHNGSGTAAVFNDYAKFGVWPDAYYMADNEFTAPDYNFTGGGNYAFNRAKMLSGDPTASYVYFHTTDGGMLPSDLDGPTPPPAGSPNYFAGFIDNTSTPDQLTIRKFHVDFTTPANSTFTGTSVNVASFSSHLCNDQFGDCIPQPVVIDVLDGLADRLLFRLAYRNFGDHESLVVNHTVNAGSGRAGVRWYELRTPGTAPTVFQQGTYAPGTEYRWMGSAAMDKFGDLAVGFSVSSAMTGTTFPSIRYAGRLPTDPPGQLAQGEATLQMGTGSQTGTTNLGSDRWGDYSGLTVDPSDDCTFWYTNEYYLTTSDPFDPGWRTRIGSFRFPSCAAIQGTTTPTVVAGTSTRTATALAATATRTATVSAGTATRTATAIVSTRTATRQAATSTRTATRLPSTSTRTSTRVPTSPSSTRSSTRTRTAIPVVSGTATATPTECTVPFTDVPSTSIFYAYIKYMYCHGVISGYNSSPPCVPGGAPCFLPSNPTTRGQVSKIVTLAFGFAINTQGGPHFSDVHQTGQGSTFYPYIETLYNKGAISGYSGTQANRCTAAGVQAPCFLPDNPVSRGQIAKIVVTSAAQADPSHWQITCPSTATFQDVAVGSTFFCYVETAYSHGILAGYCANGATTCPPGSPKVFRPDNNATRAQICKIVYLAVTYAP